MVKEESFITNFTRIKKTKKNKKLYSLGEEIGL